MRGVWSTLALVVAAAGLGAYIYFVDSERPATEAKAKVFAVEADAIEEIRVTAKGETSLLRKTDGTWKLVEPIATEVDQNEVSALVNGIANLEENREVEPNAANLARVRPGRAEGRPLVQGRGRRHRPACGSATRPRPPATCTR